MGAGVGVSNITHLSRNRDSNSKKQGTATGAARLTHVFERAIELVSDPCLQGVAEINCGDTKSGTQWM